MLALTCGLLVTAMAAKRIVDTPAAGTSFPSKCWSRRCDTVIPCCSASAAITPGITNGAPTSRTECE
jgi:hypothetical protein